MRRGCAGGYDGRRVAAGPGAVAAVSVKGAGVLPHASIVRSRIVGLDGVELVLSVEAEFGVSIDDADAAILVTPRLLADYVFGRLGNGGGVKGRCLSQAGFYRLRSVLVRQFKVSRQNVRPDSRLQDLLGRNIRRQWRALKIALEASQLPALRCRKRVAYPILVGMPAGGASLLFLAGAPGWLIIFALFLLWISAMIVTDRLGNLVPEALSTVGSLVPYVRVGKPDEWTREYVLQRVMQITAVQLGIPIGKIRPDDHFVKDLGLD